jgi:peptidyl-prolyl cis-trans isomerase SurA
MIKRVYKTALVLLGGMVLSTAVHAQEQNQVLDKIVGIVGNKIILHSELQASLEQMKNQNPALDDDKVRCDVMENLLGQKLLSEQADRDSVMVGDEELEGQLDNRIRYFVRQYGSEEKLLEITGKTVYQLKDQFRDIYREQLQAQKMQGQIMSSIKITPTEVRAFYDKIPVDSLPFYPAQVEVGQLVIKPPVSKEVEEYTIEKLEDIRKQLLEGKQSFDIMAGIYSEDPGSRDKGGDLGLMDRNELVPEFASAAFRLQNGEISPIVKTRFGYHIVQMVSRQGDKAKLRHILLKPAITSADIKLGMVKLDSIRNLIVTGKMTFAEAVGKFTTDEQTKMTGGMFVNPENNSSLVEMDQLDPGAVLMVDTMKIGSYTHSLEYYDQASGDRVCRILFLKNRTEPHKANLKEDYNKIMQVALADKQNKKLFNWLDEHVASFYIMLDPEFNSCERLSTWVKAAQSAPTTKK